MYCHYCGTKLNDDAKFCVNCGKKVVITEVSEVRPPEEPKKVMPRSRKKIFIIIAAAAAAVVVIAAVLLIVVLNRNCRISFDVGYENARIQPETQTVKKGEYAAEPAISDREGFLFMGWYEKGKGSRPYDFTLPVTKSASLTAKWYDENDTADSDSDGLPDSVEYSLGTDPSDPDSDSDGLNDGVEVKLLNLDPLNKDTDSDGIPDPDEDGDGDGLVNIEEIALGTSPLYYDTDNDGLNDNDEVYSYHTDPLNPDTDGDGVPDGVEVMIGSDPLVWEEAFTTTHDLGEPSDQVPVTVEVSAVTDAEGAGELMINDLSAMDGIAFSSCHVGYLGSSYEITTSGVLDSAEITFRYDESLGEPREGFQPCIYWYDEENDTFVEVEDQYAGNGTVTATVSHFSVYSVFNKCLVDYSRELARELKDAASSLDANNDGIIDEYARAINDGTLKYEDTTWLVGCLDSFGDIDDWDGDGLKNGEEISVVRKNGVLTINVYSNPFIVDSDHDDISDKSEKELNTNPLKYDRRSVGAYQQLNNSTKYSYSSNHKDWRDKFALAFDWKKYDQAKKCIIDYLYDYAPQDTLEKNASLMAEQQDMELALSWISTFSDVLGAVKGLGEINENVKELENLNRPYEDCDKLRTILLGELNEKSLSKENINTVEKALKAASVPEDLNKIKETLEVSQFQGAVESTALAIQWISGVIDIYTQATKCEYLSLVYEHEGMVKVLTKAGKKTPKFAAMLSFATDVVDYGLEISEINVTCGRISANADSYNRYIELLQYLNENAASEYLRSAAGDILKELIAEDGSLDVFWSRVRSYATATIETLADVALDIGSKSNQFVLILKIFLDLVDYTGFTAMGEYNIYFETMYEISEGCKYILEQHITENAYTFSYVSDECQVVEDYLVQLAQSRVIGEKYWFDYVACNDDKNWLLKLISGTDTEKYEVYFENSARDIYHNANRLKLKLSRNLPYYNAYYEDIDEDEIDVIADVFNLPPSLNEFLMHFESYGDADGGCEFDYTDISGTSRTILRKILFNASCCDLDLYPGEDRILLEGNNDDPRGWMADSPGSMCYRYDYDKVKWITKNIFHVSDRDFEAMMNAGEKDKHFYKDEYYIYYITGGIGWDVADAVITRSELKDDVYHIVYNLVWPDGMYGYLGDISDYYSGTYYAELTYEEIDGNHYWTLLKHSADIPEKYIDNTWEGAYYDFIVTGEYAELGSVFYTLDVKDDYSPVTFGLHDVNADGTPELIGFSGGDYTAAMTNYIYTYENGEVRYLGTMSPNTAHYFDDPDYPGLLINFAHTGSYVAQYFTIVDGELRAETVSISEDQTPEMRNVEIERTDDDRLYQLFKEGNTSEVQMVKATDLLVSRNQWDVLCAPHHIR